MQPAPISVLVSVDVSPSDILQGVFGIEGVLGCTEEAITFAYKTTGVRGRTLTEEAFALPLEDAREIEFKRGLGESKIILRPWRLLTLERVPWAGPDAFIFKVKRTHRAEAAALVAQLERRLSDQDAEAARRIPFQLPDANLGFTEIKGLLYFDEAYLVFDVMAGISGGIKKKRQTIKIEARALEALHLDQGVLHDQLIVRPKERDLFRVMPGMYKGKDVLTLKIKKRYRADAEDLVDAVRDCLAR